MYALRTYFLKLLSLFNCLQYYLQKYTIHCTTCSTYNTVLHEYYVLVFFWHTQNERKKLKNKNFLLHLYLRYIEDIARWREDMNFMFEWKEQYITSERSERVRYCSCHENIKFISSSQRVMFFLLYGETNSTKAKGGNRDIIEQYDTHKGDIRKYATRVQDEVAYRNDSKCPVGFWRYMVAVFCHYHS